MCIFEQKKREICENEHNRPPKTKWHKRDDCNAVNRASTPVGWLFGRNTTSVKSDVYTLFGCISCAPTQLAQSYVSFVRFIHFIHLRFVDASRKFIIYFVIFLCFLLFSTLALALTLTMTPAKTLSLAWFGLV